MFKDRVKETSTTTGTGNLTLAGAATAFRSFSSVIGLNVPFGYVIALQGGSEWEVGRGYLSAASTLVRSSILASSNADAAVNFSAGAKDVWLDIVAEDMQRHSVDPTALSLCATYGVTVEIQGIAYGRGRWVCCLNAASTSSILYSLDQGRSWAVATTPSSAQWRAITYAESIGLFCAVGLSGKIATSSDGVTWTDQTSGTAQNFSSIAWSPALTLFVALCGTSTNAYATCFTSPDGVTWTSQNMPTTSEWRCVIWVPELALFVACNSSGTAANAFATSSNGTAWTTRAATTTTQYGSLAWNGVNLVAVSSESTVRASYSPDGTTWTDLSSGAPAANSPQNGVIWNGNCFIAINTTSTDSYVSTSRDGRRWSQRRLNGNAAGTSDTSLNGSWLAIAYDPHSGRMAMGGSSAILAMAP